jgi:hypothetical protein
MGSFGTHVSNNIYIFKFEHQHMGFKLWNFWQVKNI